MRFRANVRTVTLMLALGTILSGCHRDEGGDDAVRSITAPSPAATTSPSPAPTPSPSPTPGPAPAPAPVPVPRPATCSIKTWACSPNGFGAIAYSPSGGRSGWAYNFSTRAAAESRAIQECGGGDCRVAAWFQNQCGALARSSDGSWSSGLGTSQSAAEANAMSSCRATQQSPTLTQPACAPNGSSAINVPIRNTTELIVVVTFTGSITRTMTIGAGATKTLSLSPGTYRATGEVVGVNNVVFEPSTWTVSSGCTYSLQIVAR
jgi:hypothetical protein